MKIKVKPEDFVVIEKAQLPLEKGGRFKVYLLTKKGYNTLDVLQRVSKKLKLPYSKFSYGGKKDRYALTSQYITVEGEKIEEVKEKSYSLKYIGEMSRPMGPDLILKNEFKIRVRALEEKEGEKLIRGIEEVKKYGFPNYFDDQRFGSYSKKEGFIAEKILKKHYNGALKIYLTSISPGMKKEDKERKRYFLERWGEWEICLKNAKTRFEKEAFRILKEEPKSFHRVLRLIPREQLSIFFSSFQSFLWNMVAERLVRIYGEGILKYKGNYWNYVFYRKISNFETVKNLLLPTPSKNAKMPDSISEKIYKEILEERGIKPSHFNLKKIRTYYFKSVQRPFVVIPEIKEFQLTDDEIYTGKKSLYLHFELPRGSYGTMLIKRLAAEERK